ncbi:hypothetical protein OKW46_007327 [Paraburkholderia sp. WSM4179]|nr:hypothetical protein [Paraburkholderia sp. WSM4179]
MDAPAGTTQTHSLNAATMAGILQFVRQISEINTRFVLRREKRPSE